MLIHRQFRLAFGAIVFAIVAALFIVAAAHGHMRRVEELRSWSHQVMRAVFDSNLLGSESILQENSRAIEQFASVSRELERLLAAPPPGHLIDEHVAALRSRKNRLDSLIADFAVKPDEPSAAPREEFELQTMLATQWMLQTRELLDAAYDLRAYAVQRSEDLRGGIVFINLLAVLLVACICGAIFWRLNRTLIRPLHDLSEAARRIGAGELDSCVPVESKNEIGMVAENFNAMAAQLRARQAELDEKLRDLEAFSYSVAHDLKAPLRSVAGYCGVLEADYRDRIDDEGRDCLDRIRLGCARMSALIDDLLEFGQLTHKSIEIRPVSIDSIFGQLIVEMEPEIRARNGEVEYKGGPAKALGNEVVLKQALRNLISNGLKFVPEGVPPRVVVSAKRADGWLRIEVADNGIGIPLEHQKRIFGLFQRLHTQKEYPGTGVGLAIVQKSVERLQGEAGVDSAPGQGSVFWIALRPSANL